MLWTGIYQKHPGQYPFHRFSMFYCGFGNYAFFEKLLAVLVAVMGLAFLATMFIDFPSVSELMAGLVPKVPEVAKG